jgi:hypothetical protein
MVMTVLLSSIAFAGCGQTRQGRGPVVLVLDSLTAASGAEPDEFGTLLASDVLTYVKVEAVRVPTIFEDPGKADFHLQMKDDQFPTSPTNAITLTRYRVTYSRSDGRNTPGVDVPYPIDGAVSVTVSGSASVGFSIVRAAAKSEAPLKALVAGGGAKFISTIAEVTFYGTDAAGNTVSVSGQMTVTFSDWGDPA